MRICARSPSECPRCACGTISSEAWADVGAGEVIARTRVMIQPLRQDNERERSAVVGSFFSLSLCCVRGFCMMGLYACAARARVCVNANELYYAKPLGADERIDEAYIWYRRFIR